MTRYKSVCTRWDVVNEALNEDGTYRSSVWLDTIGEAYLPIAFRFANKYRGKAELFYNDYNLEYNAEKTQGAQRIVKLIKSYGVRIDGVGYQAHLASEPTPSAPGAAPDQATLEAALRATADLGVDVVYTEIDLRMLTPATPESHSCTSPYRKIIGVIEKDCRSNYACGRFSIADHDCYGDIFITNRPNS
jgi:endo-1,4-beta-xylanase